MRRIERLYDAPVIVGHAPGCRAPGFFHDFTLTDIFGSHDGRVIIGTCKNDLVAQIEHEHVGIAFIERAMNGCVGLRGENHRRLRLANDASRPVVGERGFGSGDDLLSLVREKNDEIVVRALFGGFVESAQRMEIIREFQDRIDVKALRLKFLRHGNAHDFSLVDLANGKCWFLGAKTSAISSLRK